MRQAIASGALAAAKVLGLMVRDAPQAALLTTRVSDLAAKQDLILKEPAKGGRLEGWAAKKAACRKRGEGAPNAATKSPGASRGFRCLG